MLVDQSTIETRDGCFFIVNGSLHPPGRYVGILAYVPFEERHEGDPLITKKVIEGREYAKVSRAWFSPYRGRYFEQISGYHHYFYYHPFFGQITSVPEDQIKRFIWPRPVQGVAVDACSLLGVSTNDALLVGSNMLDCDFDDIDLAIVGRHAVTKAVENLRELVTNQQHQVYHDYFARTHPRQFIFNRKKVDFFPLYAEGENQPLKSISKIGDFVEVNGIIEDETDSPFSPSTYVLRSGESFITYQIEQRMTLRRNERIQTRAWRIFSTSWRFVRRFH